MPIVELRTAFGMPTIDYSGVCTVIIAPWSCGIASWGWSWIPCRMLSLSAKRTSRPRRTLEPKWMRSFLSGIGKSGDKLVALLNIDQLLTEDTCRRQPLRRPEKLQGNKRARH